MYHIYMEGVIISLAALIFLAHLFSFLFTKTGVPEVLPLMLLGMLLGPVLNLVSPSEFGRVDLVFTRILLIIILFDSGLRLRVSQIRGAWAQGGMLSVLGYTAVFICFSLLAKFLIKLDWTHCIILGAILADNSFAISIPLFSKLSITERIKSIMLLETTLASVIAIILTITMIDMARAEAFSAGFIGAKVLYAFVVSFIVGTLSAIFWTTILNKVRRLDNSIFLTLAFVFVVYSICQSLGGDGTIGAFVFGIIAGNIRVLKKMLGLGLFGALAPEVKSKSFNEIEKSFFAEVLFIMRTFFFVYIGTSIHLSSWFALSCGLAFVALNFIVRAFVVNYTLDKNINRTDAAVAAAMIPKGLVTAVLAALLSQAGLIEEAKAVFVQDVIYSTIFFSILFSTIFSACAQRCYIYKMSSLFFGRHKPDNSQQARECLTPPPNAH